MARWTVRDRYGNEIYMTGERWQHIISKHHDLIGQRYRYRYRYRYRCLVLPNDNNRITVVVVFSYN